MDIAFLRNHPLTFGLQSAQLKQLGELLEEVSVAPGERLLGEGLPVRGLFLLKDGRLRIAIKGKDGQPRTVAELDAPTVVGEMELMSGNPSAASVVAETPVSGYLLPVEAYTGLIEKGDPALSKLTRNIARVLVLRLEETNRRVVGLVEPLKLQDLGGVAANWKF